MRKSDNIRELEYLASSQWGLFTTAQAAALGVGRTQVSRMSASGTVEPVRRGTYRYVMGEDTSHLDLKAAWLSCYPKLTAAERLRSRPHDAVVACATAASLHGIGDLHEDPYTFIVRSRRQTSMPDLELHLWDLDELDITHIDTLPVTTMERTVADLVRQRQDPSHVAQAVRDAGAKGADVRRLQELLGDLGPSYSAAKDALFFTIHEFVVQREILDDAMALLEGRGQADGHELSPEERAFVDIVRRRLRPIIEARASEIAAQREADGGRLANDGHGAQLTLADGQNPARRVIRISRDAKGSNDA